MILIIYWFTSQSLVWIRLPFVLMFLWIWFVIVFSTFAYLPYILVIYFSIFALKSAYFVNTGCSIKTDNFKHSEKHLNASNLAQTWGKMYLYLILGIMCPRQSWHILRHQFWMCSTRCIFALSEEKTLKIRR